uniref:Heat shock transcription factor A2 n=1 Tax=Lilium longiflorum TaxID=4690 RepID=E0Z2D9_LILLO|nr:heat shock transcription factor A2 [Lilium longiflorum]
MASEMTKDGIAVVVVKDEEELLQPEPMPGLHGTALPPFLTKTFEMVEDANTDGIVSWSMERNSFIVWDPYRLSSDLLPRYFKHGNFSSFIRQLNTYGFRKVFPDRWEFAHEKFLGGQKNLLKDIKRRRNVGQSLQQKDVAGAGASPDLSPGTRSCVELGQFGFEAEVDRLKRDHNILVAEIMKLKQQQQTSRTQILAIEERIQGTERMQQRTAAFLARAFKNPSFIEQLLLQSDRKKQQLESLGRKRILTATTSSENLQPDGVDIGADMVNLLSTMGNISSSDQKAKAVFEPVDQDFGVISDVFLEEFLVIGVGEGEQTEVELEDLAAYQYDWVDVKEMADELGYLDSQP